MKVLIADDDPVARAIVEKIVRDRGYEPVVTEGGRAAMAAITKEEIPLLVTDWNMPDVDGLELCRRIRAPQRKAYTYVILLTTQSGRKKLLEALDAGIDDFLTKPVDADELAARLRSGERIIAMQKELRQMQGLLSICMYCKKIREGKEWVPVDRYVADHTATSFSHGLCPECLKRQMEP
jgi:sigma-B regulation protein RsbU (phosphoserine phosphatase)